MCLRLSSAFASGNIATTSGYLHAKPKSSSGLHLDEGVFLRRRRVGGAPKDHPA
jgi:hypothetical protein